ncbi:hypothetical protein GCM10011273_00880 [Asticcacaulis endophyticus]|uniref:Uncharacterized protein n=1 Tax=Asticcacaulis endophyticus TaxID=1395890 RepID=A0A918UM34_9CAUL|nr:hypothetical protein GCM10011273_00880 [Asticcacaulis endophyticus]
MVLAHSIENSKGWKSQYETMTRWYHRCEKIHVDGCYVDFHDAWDFGFSFFIACHSLKDWLKKQCPTYVAPEYPICMKICRDIANRAKHLRLDQASLDADWSMVREYDHYKDGVKLKLVFEGHKKDYKFPPSFPLISVIRDCQKFWEIELRRQNLL